MRSRQSWMLAKASGAAIVVGLAGAACGVAEDSEESVGVAEDELSNGFIAPAAGATGWRVANVDGQCSGTVIDPWWVLTARHCLSGDKDPSWIDIALEGEGRDVTHVYMHPDHLDGENGVDVMMLRLSAPFTNIPSTEIPFYYGDTVDLVG